MSDAFDNRLRRTLRRLERLPRALSAPLRSWLVGRAIPFVGTAGVALERIAEDEVIAVLANRRRVRNHIGGVHAAAMALLAETASGIVLGMNVPDERVPLIVHLGVDYLERAHGGLRAVARLAPADIARVRSEERGQLDVPVEVSDESGAQPIRCHMRWAWVTRRR